MDPNTAPPIKPTEQTQQSPSTSGFVALVQQCKNDPVCQATMTGAAGTIVAALLTYAAIRIGKSITQHIWRFFGWLGGLRGFSRLALRVYLRKLVDIHGKLVNIYLNTVEELSLQRVFVPLTLRSTGQVALETLPRTTKQILTDAEQKRLVLLGAPGSGKSTLLKALAAGVSRREWVDFRDLVPVLVPLRAYGQAADQTALLPWLVETLLPGFGLRKGGPLLESLLQQGRVLLLLDGLDEVAGERLDTVNRRIAEFLRAWDGAKACRVLLTCREQNYDALPDRQHYLREGFTEYRVAELRDSEIRDIVQRRAYSFEANQKSLPRYLEQIYLHPGITHLHRNPLLLTLSMGVYLYRPGEEVPQNLADFYELAIDNLLRRHDFRESDLAKANQFKAEDKFRFLRYFALESLQRATGEGRDFEEFSFEALTAAAEALAEQGKVGIAPDQAHGFVQEIHKHSGLLSALRDPKDDRRDGLFVFAHRSLHEFCAAAGLAKQGEQGFRAIVEQLGNAAWRQVIFFYCAMEHDNAVQLVEAIRQRAGNGAADSQLLALAGHCAAVLAEPRPALRLAVLDQVDEALRRADGADRPHLLKSLLALGNSRGREIRERLDASLRRFVGIADVAEVAKEVGRMEPEVALQFLGVLAEGDDLGRKVLALRVLWGMEGLGKIPLLWKLLLDLHNDQLFYKEIALAQLLSLMNIPSAVDNLNECTPNPPKALEPSLDRVKEIYPFLIANSTPSNFILSLVWTAESSKDKFDTLFKFAALNQSKLLPKMDEDGFLEDKEWLFKFLQIVISQKNKEELKEWQRLPADRYRRMLKIETLRLGQSLWGVPELFGLFLTLATFVEITNLPSEDRRSAFLAIIFFGWICGVILDFIFYLWFRLLKRFDNLGAGDVFPKPLRNRAWEIMFSPNIAHIGGYFLLFNLSFFLISTSPNSLATTLSLYMRQPDSTEILKTLFVWLILTFVSYFLPALKWFDRGHVIYLRKPNRYLHLYDIPGVERWLPPEK